MRAEIDQDEPALDYSYGPIERWFDDRFMPFLQGVGVFFLLPLIAFVVGFNVARLVQPCFH